MANAITPTAQQIALAFEEMGGVKKLAAWAKTHPKEFYTQLLTKLVPMQLNADVNATVRADEEQQAVEALKNALMRVIEVQRADPQKSENTRNVAAEASLVTGVTYSRTTAAEPDPTVTPPRPLPAPAIARQSPENIFPLRAADATTNAKEPTVVAPITFDSAVSAEPTTTQKYLEWAGRYDGRVHPKDWGPV